jgi:hypothetical protein
MWPSRLLQAAAALEASGVATDQEIGEFRVLLGRTIYSIRSDLAAPSPISLDLHLKLSRAKVLKVLSTFASAAFKICFLQRPACLETSIEGPNRSGALSFYLVGVQFILENTMGGKAR